MADKLKKLFDTETEYVNAHSSYNHGQMLFLFSLLIALIEEQDEETLKKLHLKAQSIIEMIEEHHGKGTAPHQGATYLANFFKTCFS